MMTDNTVTVDINRRDLSEPLVWSADDRAAAIQSALRYHVRLVQVLETRFEAVLLQATKHKPLSPDLMRAVVKSNQSATVVVWDLDLLRGAIDSRFKYKQQVIDEAFLPSNSQLWVSSKGSVETMRLSSEQYFVSARIIVPFPEQHLVAGIKVLHPSGSTEADLDAVPTLVVCGTARAGEMYDPDQGDELYSCLHYMGDTFEATVQTSKTNQPKVVKALSPEAVPVNVIILRQKTKELTNSDQKEKRQGHWRYEVREFIRRPSPLMRAPHPIKVRAHMRGPAEGPLKPKTPTVIVVSR